MEHVIGSVTLWINESEKKREPAVGAVGALIASGVGGARHQWGLLDINRHSEKITKTWISCFFSTT